MLCIRELELELGDIDLARVQNCLHLLASLQIEARAEAKPIEQLEGQCCQLFRTFRPSLDQKRFGQAEKKKFRPPIVTPDPQNILNNP
jgi:hypothetical protein